MNTNAWMDAQTWLSYKSQRPGHVQTGDAHLNLCRWRAINRCESGKWNLYPEAGNNLQKIKFFQKQKRLIIDFFVSENVYFSWASKRWLQTNIVLGVYTYQVTNCFNFHHHFYRLLSMFKTPTSYVSVSIKAFEPFRNTMILCQSQFDPNYSYIPLNLLLIVWTDLQS